MTTMFVRHRVADYAAWRQAYDGFAAIRDEGGVLAAAVYQTADDPNELTVAHDFASVEAAQAFGADPRLRAAMDAGGVVGAPTIWLTTRL